MYAAKVLGNTEGPRRGLVHRAVRGQRKEGKGERPVAKRGGNHPSPPPPPLRSPPSIRGNSARELGICMHIDSVPSNLKIEEVRSVVTMAFSELVLPGMEWLGFKADSKWGRNKSRTKRSEALETNFFAIGCSSHGRARHRQRPNMSIAAPTRTCKVQESVSSTVPR